MFRTIRNLVVSIMAMFISDREKRHAFRNKYKIKSKFRKLRDDNRRMFNDIQALRGELGALRVQFREMEEDRSFEYRVKPLDINPPKMPDHDVFLAIATVAKNEGPYLREWIEYHKIVGVDRIYFYDNESNDNTKEILAPYIKDGYVLYHLLPNHPINRKVPHVEAYNDAIFRYRDNTKWMAILDIDEFVVPVEKDTIPEFLADYEQYPGVVVNWVCFDSNGHDKKPTAHGGLLTANYTRVRKEHTNNIGGMGVHKDTTIKSIVNPREVIHYNTEHYALYYRNFKAVTENFEMVSGQITRVHSSNKIRINHYVTKSKEEYLEKIIRNGKGTSNIYKLHDMLLNFQEETTEDLVIQKYVPKLKLALGIKD